VGKIVCLYSVVPVVLYICSIYFLPIWGSS